MTPRYKQKLILTQQQQHALHYYCIKQKRTQSARSFLVSRLAELGIEAYPAQLIIRGFKTQAANHHTNERSLKVCGGKCNQANQTWLMTITTPQKHGKENNSNDSVLTKDENIEPLVAFSRPPPLPPFLGPLIMLSLFNMSSGGI
uniref:Uncharacterized protein n=1 Tax=Oryza punctata TaxID=4537 RepID=A0A0E0KUA0_ORYPU